MVHTRYKADDALSAEFVAALRDRTQDPQSSQRPRPPCTLATLITTAMALGDGPRIPPTHKPISTNQLVVEQPLPPASVVEVPSGFFVLVTIVPMPQ